MRLHSSQLGRCDCHPPAPHASLIGRCHICPSTSGAALPSSPADADLGSLLSSTLRAFADPLGQPAERRVLESQQGGLEGITYGPAPILGPRCRRWSI